MVMKRLFMDLLKNQISDRQTRNQTPYITAAWTHTTIKQIKMIFIFDPYLTSD